MLLMNQDGITELIKIANDIQNRVNLIMSVNAKPPPIGRDRIASAAPEQTTAATLFNAAKEKLPIIMEDETAVSVTPSKQIFLY